MKYPNPNMTRKPKSKQSQIDYFRAGARSLDADEDEADRAAEAA